MPIVTYRYRLDLFQKKADSITEDMLFTLRKPYKKAQNDAMIRLFSGCPELLQVGSCVHSIQTKAGNVLWQKFSVAMLECNTRYKVTGKGTIGVGHTVDFILIDLALNGAKTLGFIQSQSETKDHAGKAHEAAKAISSRDNAITVIFQGAERDYTDSAGIRFLRGMAFRKFAVDTLNNKHDDIAVLSADVNDIIEKCLDRLSSEVTRCARAALSMEIVLKSPEELQQLRLI